jgi:hypothetical protein
MGQKSSSYIEELFKPNRQEKAVLISKSFLYKMGQKKQLLYQRAFYIKWAKKAVLI